MSTPFMAAIDIITSLRAEVARLKALHLERTKLTTKVINERDEFRAEVARKTRDWTLAEKEVDELRAQVASLTLERDALREQLPACIALLQDVAMNDYMINDHMLDTGRRLVQMAGKLAHHLDLSEPPERL